MQGGGVGGVFFFSSRRRHTRFTSDWSSDVCSSDLIIRERFLTEKKISFKGRSDIVTDVDLEVESRVLDRVKYEYPEFSVLAEESSPIETDRKSVV